MHYDNERDLEALNKALEGNFVGKSNTPEQEKDLWQTPIDFFMMLDREFNFDVDACASPDNALCEFWFAEGYSALENEWDLRGGAVFINPPYSQTEIFLNRAAEQAKKHNINVVALVNANTDTKWFKQASATANEIRLITGRLSFSKPNGEKANGNTKGQCLIVWYGKCPLECKITLIDRD